MNKALGAATIIPPALYVHRDADRQLRRVVEEMGRPGYVLVARQMGKTNLLLNAKRELQQAGDYFLYVDLSNQFSSAQACFRNIIDTVLDSSDFTWSTAAERCRAIRKEGLPDHKEHERELRALLRDHLHVTPTITATVQRTLPTPNSKTGEPPVGGPTLD